MSEEKETQESAPAADKPTKTGGNKPVVIYILILFVAAFLLMTLSLLMHQRSNTEALGQLKDSVTAMQEVQADQEKIIGLQEELKEAQATIEDMEDAAEQAERDLLNAQLETQALLSLYTLQQQYSLGDYAACQETIQKIEVAGYETLLPKESENDVTAPSVRFRQLKEAVEARLGEQAG